MSKQFYLSLAFVFIYTISKPQNLSITSAPIPPSPAAQSIIRAADFSASHYTGSPNITIPLFTLQGQDLNLPINLVYSANGFKVNDFASWVGYGWSLSCSGAVSRTIMDSPDDFGFGFSKLSMDTYYNNKIYPKTEECKGITSINSPQFFFYKLLSSGAQGQPTFYDTEPDLYSYSMPTGLSGKFVFDRFNRIQLLPKNNVKISVFNESGNLNTSSFFIQDDKGVEYTFDKFERIRTIVSSTNFKMNGVSRLNDMYPISTWYIKSMKSSTSDEKIDYTYTPEYTTYESPDSESKSFLILPPSPADPIGVPYEDFDYKSKTINQVEGQRLSTIDFQNYKVNFIADNTARTDLTGSHRLKKIVITHRNDTIKVLEFFHSYLDASYLRLDSLVEYGANSQRLYATKFTYYESLMSVSRNSYSIDHWGYYNGAYNLTLLPRYFRPNISYVPGLMYDINFKGANREPNIEYLKHGIIKEIKYQTGGSSVFEYEQNTYSRFGTEYEQIEETKTVLINPALTNNIIEGLNYIDEEIFTVTQDTTYLWVEGIETCETGDGNLPADCGILIIGVNLNYSQALIKGSEAGTLFRLRPGTYKLKATMSIYRQNVIGATIKWFRRGNLLINKPGPGLRVKSIKQFDKDQSKLLSRKDYVYEFNGVSSGLLHDILRYDYNVIGNNNNINIAEEVPGNYDNLQTNCDNASFFYGVRILESNSLNSFINNSVQLGYNKVKEVSFSDPSLQIENGYTIYEFHNEFSLSTIRYANLSDLVTGGLNVPTTSFVGLSGKPLAIQQYSKDNKLLSESYYEYQLSVRDTVIGFQVAPLVQQNCTFCNYNIKQYFHLSYDIVETRQSNFVNNNNEVLKTETLNYYGINSLNGSFYLKRKINSDSKNSYLITDFYYPFDFDIQFPSSVYTQMKNLNFSSPIYYVAREGVKDNENRFITSKVLDTKLILYYKHVKGYFKQSEIFEFNSDNFQNTMNTWPLTSLVNLPSFLERKSIFVYDGSGNISSISTNNNEVKSFQWSATETPELVSICDNCAQNSYFYDSFEYENGVKDLNSLTGKYVRNSNFTFQPPTTFQVIPGSTLSYWFWSNSKWNFFSIPYTGGSIQINQGTKIDELRITPPQGRITSYTYAKASLLNDVCDPNGMIMRYRYDDFLRLSSIYKNDGSIISDYRYQYEK